MKDKIKIIFLTLFTISVLGACKEAVLQPSEQQPQQYSLPQGNYPFDQRIVDFHKKYGTYILYKFTEKDFRWNFTTPLSYSGIPADPDRVEKALNFLDKELFGYYNEELLKQLLPFKFMLSKEIRWLNVTPGDPDPGPIDAVCSESHVAFGHVDPRWESFSEQKIRAVKGSLHGTFWQSAIERKKIEKAPNFMKGIDYSNVGSWNYRGLGIFDSKSNRAHLDLGDYIARITSHTLAELEALYFNPEFDPTGIYREKYEALIAFYKQNYKIDLQAIGDAKLH